MEKAETMMLKMGWSQGRGLGKNEDGVVSAVKLNTQRSRQGFGYSEVDKDLWWVKIYDEAAKNVNSYTPSEKKDNSHEETLKIQKRKISHERDVSISDVRKNKKQKKSKKQKEFSEQSS